MTLTHDSSNRRPFWQTRSNRIHTLLGVPMIFALAMLLISSALPSPTENTRQRADNEQFLSFAYNLVKSGVYSHRGENPGQAGKVGPTRLREPMYPLTLTIPLLLSERTDQISLRCLVREPECADVRLLLMVVNLTTISLLIAAAFLVGRMVVGSWVGGYGVVALLLAANYFVIKDTSIALNSEALAALLMLGHSAFLFLAVRQGLKRKLAPSLSGLLLGLLILTKAVFLYWLFSLVALLVLHVLVNAIRGRLPAREVLLPVLCFFALASIFPALWSARNYHHFSEFKLADRGGSILVGRAAFLEMHRHEYRAGMCRWTPHRYRTFRDFVCKGITESDMQRFARNHHEEGTFDNIKLNRKRALDESRRNANVEDSADEVFRQSGLGRILSQPVKHIALIPLFAYRGMWISLEARHNNWYPQMTHLRSVFLKTGRFSEAISPFFFPVLFLAFLVSVYKRAWEYVFFFMPAIFCFSIYSALTHFIPRYSTPLIPILIVTFVLTLMCIARWCVRRFGRGAGR